MSEGRITRLEFEGGMHLSFDAYSRRGGCFLFAGREMRCAGGEEKTRSVWHDAPQV